jgi:3-oxoadipate enol-lactonase
MPVVRVNGVDLHYEERGDAGAQHHLLVTHGLLGSMDAMRRFGDVVERVAVRGVHVVSYDARGHGRSGYTRREEDYSWRALAEDMRGLVEALGLERPSVYGASMGAGTALMLAMEHPGVLDRLILRAPPPFGRNARRARGAFAMLAMLYRLFGPQLASQMVMLAPQVRRAQRRSPGFDIREFFAGQRGDAAVAAIRGLMFVGDPLPLHRLPEIRNQALILTHPDDVIHPLESGEILHERMPHARLAVAPTQAYWAENADALVHVVAAFVKGEEVARGLPQKVLHEHDRHAPPGDARPE